jgi:glycine betaine/proline transport system substrate-binding protein
VANDDFLNANPAAAALFEAVQIPLNDISDMTRRISEGESGDDDIDAMASEWIENNRDTVDGWLEQARSASM